MAALVVPPAPPLGPPPGGGGSSSDPTAGVGATAVPPAALIEEAQQYAVYARRRNLLGIGLVFVGIVLVAVLLFRSIAGLDDAVKAEPKLVAYAIALLATHAVVTVAGVYFGYQLIRAGERLLLLPKTIESAEVDRIRALLGVETPASAAGKALNESVDRILDVGTKVAEAVGKAVGAAKGSSK